MADSAGPIEAETEAIAPVVPETQGAPEQKKTFWEGVWYARKKIPTIIDIVGISDNAWSKLAWIAAIVCVPAMAVNFSMVVAYAVGVSAHAPLVRDAGIIAMLANGTVALGQVAVAGMLQLGTDFGLLFAASLAKGRNRGTPTAAMFLWLICAINTIEMKKSMYDQLRDGRILTLQEKADAAKPIEVTQAEFALAPYEAKPTPKIVPATVEASNADITLSEDSIATLKSERVEQVAARDEETKTGRKEKWQEHDDRIKVIDTDTSGLRTRIAGDHIAVSERQAYDAALKKVSDWQARPKITVSAIGYDSVAAIWLRTYGMSLLGLISILTAFAAGKMSEDKRREAEEKRKRSEAALKGSDTKRRKPKITDVDFDPMEAASTEAKGIPFDPTAAPGATSPAHTRSPPPSRHPDKDGDGAPVPWMNLNRGGDDGADEPDQSNDER